MTVAYTQYAKLDGQKAQKLQELENDLGAWVVAVEPQAHVAPLSQDQLQRLRSAEQELGVILLAYKPDGA